MSKSAIYTTNTTEPTITAGSVIPVGVTSRRFGCNLRQDGNTITLCGSGYYKVTAVATVTPPAAGTVSLTAQKDGVAVIGATSSATTAAVNETVTLTVSAILRNACGCDSSILSFVLGDSAAVVNNLSVTVKKLVQSVDCELEHVERQRINLECLDYDLAAICAEQDGLLARYSPNYGVVAT